MRTTLILGALAGLAAATPMAKRQAIEFDQFDAAAPVPDLTAAPLDPAADPGSYDSSAAASAAAQSPVTTDTAPASKVKRTAPCASEPAASGPTTSPDTDKDFLADPQYNQIANAAVIPQGYSLAFSGLQGSTEGPSYITYKTMKSYDPIQCQQFCDSADGCFFFNVYMERDPTVNPDDACPNPASGTNYKCSLFGAQQSNKTATNLGGWRRQFHVVISGSNGYNKLAAPDANPGFQGPTELSGAINAPDNSYIGYKYFKGPYDPSQCAQSCLATTAYNQKHPKSDGSYDTCAFFNSYVLSKNNAPQGTYCSMYTKTWSKKYATNFGQYRGSDYYSTSQSYGWTLNQS